MDDLKKQPKKAHNVFETTDLDLGAFLMLHGLVFAGIIGLEGNRPKPKVVMQFLDEKQNARDLERVYMTSSEKRFRDLNKYLLREAHQALKDKGK